MPVIELTTTDFVRLAQLQARAMGYPSLRLIVVPHPLGGLTAEKALEKVPDAVEQTIRFFEGSQDSEG